MSQRPRDLESKATEGSPPGLTRATFVKAAGGALIGGMILTLDPIGASADTLHKLGPLRTLDHSSLSTRVGERFTLSHAGKSFAVRLSSVSELARQKLPRGTHRRFTATESFRAVFRGSGMLQLPQGTYSIRQRGSRTFSVFLVPGLGSDGRFEYSADFNRLTN